MLPLEAKASGHKELDLAKMIVDHSRIPPMI
jgi:hypothetical protein